MSRRSFYEATARQRIAGILDADSFIELMGPAQRAVSPHLKALGMPVAFDDGAIVGGGRLSGKPVLVAAQEGGFLGGAVGEVHAAKIVGLLERAQREHPEAVLLLIDSGGVRLHEANAGLIGVSEIIRAILAARSKGIVVIAAIGGPNGCFGGMGIAAACCSAIVMSEEGRLALSGPEVIEAANGVEEFDSRDRALIWRTTGGKHRYLLGDCDFLVEGELSAFREGIIAAIGTAQALTLETLDCEHAMLARRLENFGSLLDGRDVWGALGWSDPDRVPLAPTDVFLVQAAPLRAA